MRFMVMVKATKTSEKPRTKQTASTTSNATMRRAARSVWRRRFSAARGIATPRSASVACREMSEGAGRTRTFAVESDLAGRDLAELAGTEVG